MTQVTQMTIAGMSCGHCVAAVKAALEAVPGITVEQVAIGKATVSYDPAVVTPDTITDAVQDAGYEASLAS